MVIWVSLALIREKKSTFKEQVAQLQPSRVNDKLHILEIKFTSE